MNNEQSLDFELPAPMHEINIVRTPGDWSVQDYVADEVPVSLAYNGISHVVMMCTPKQLKEFAVGFSISEGIVPAAEHIYDMTVMPGCNNGLVVDMEIAPRFFWKLKDQRRSMTGRTGCGICGTENLEAVNKKIEPKAVTYHYSMDHYHEGLKMINAVQEIGSKTGSMHSVVAMDENGRFLGGCEDIGRHVAMDKILGMKAMSGWEHISLFMSSRASFEMVQKAAVCGVEILFAISAPTLRAIELAKQCNVTLVAFCRENKANIYTCPERILKR